MRPKTDNNRNVVGFLFISAMIYGVYKFTKEPLFENVGSLCTSIVLGLLGIVVITNRLNDYHYWIRNNSNAKIILTIPLIIVIAVFALKEIQADNFDIIDKLIVFATFGLLLFVLWPEKRN